MLVYWKVRVRVSKWSIDRSIAVVKSARLHSPHLDVPFWKKAIQCGHSRHKKLDQS